MLKTLITQFECPELGLHQGHKNLWNSVSDTQSCRCARFVNTNSSLTPEPSLCWCEALVDLSLRVELELLQFLRKLKKARLPPPDSPCKCQTIQNPVWLYKGETQMCKNLDRVPQCQRQLHCLWWETLSDSKTKQSLQHTDTGEVVIVLLICPVV